MSDTFQTPFTNPGVPTPDPTSGHEGTKGGFDIKDGKKETPDSLGTRPTLWDVKDAPSGGTTPTDITDEGLENFHHQGGMTIR